MEEEDGLLKRNEFKLEFKIGQMRFFLPVTSVLDWKSNLNKIHIYFSVYLVYQYLERLQGLPLSLRGPQLIKCHYLVLPMGQGPDQNIAVQKKNHHHYLKKKIVLQVGDYSWVKVFRINPELRFLRLTFCRKYTNYK